MRNNVQLYINDQLVDLFDFEDINVVDSIQNSRDISKIFVPYSREFSVPASKNNNKIFKHYYNYKINNGFDARFKVSATIKINHKTYKKGKITLLNASLKNGVAYKYKLIFYDNTIDLNTVLGDDLLKEINTPLLSKYNLEYNADNVFTGLTLGYNLVNDELVSIIEPVDNSDLVIPFISTNAHYFYDGADNPSEFEAETESRNVYGAAVLTPKGISWKDLRPSLRVPIVIQAIQEKYPSITFSGGFFDTNNPAYNRLYLWLNSDKAVYGEERTLNIDIDDFSLSSGSTELRPLNAVKNFFTDGVYYRFFVTITVDNDSDEYNLKVINKTNNKSLYDETGKGSREFSFNWFGDSRDGTVGDLDFEVSGLESESLDLDLRIERWITYDNAREDSTFDVSSEYTYSGATANLVFNVANNMPKMKVIDFLTGLFKTFNLTAYVNEDGSIVVETLDNYYLTGNTVDITKFVNTEEVDVSRNKLYSKIDFTFDDAKTFATINSNELSSDEFGNERIENINDDEELAQILAFDGGEYEISNGFEKMQYERMTDQDDAAGGLTGVGWGWCVDKDESPIVTSPLLHYTEHTTLSLNGFTYFILFDTLIEGDYEQVYSYHRPSNSLSTESVHGQSLHFGSEWDEYYNTLGSNEVSLFNRYWKNTVLSLYDEKSRIVSVKGKLPASLITSIKLNDVLVIKGNKFRINKLDINITTGDTKFELVTYREITPYVGLTVDTDTYLVDSDLITVDKTV